ncbi:MAG: hypothetical protein ABSB96_09380 [Gaiellaceae bacterium]
MSALWTNDGSGWALLSSVGFPDEATLHDLIEEAPGLLPLSGAPQLVMLGREVALPSGSADLVAVEVTGQPVFIEIKLQRNPEARRAVVAQVLSYAASVYGLDVESFEGQVLGRHLRARDYSSIADAVGRSDESGTFEAEPFTATLADCLATGTARLVLVLDAAPPELMRLAGYLEAVSERLVIDLITVSVYEVGGQRVLVPQRVDPGREQEERVARVARPASATARYVEGAAEFVASLEQAPEERRSDLRELSAWADGLERDGLARLATTMGKYWTMLRVRLVDEDVSPAIISNQAGAMMAIWPSVLQRRAPASLARVEQAIAPKTFNPSGGATSPGAITPELLDALAAAYQEAATARLLTPPTS